MLKIPTIMTADEIIESAFKKAAKVQLVGKSKEDMIRLKNVAKVNSISDQIVSTLRKYHKAFPNLDGVPPFYYDIIDLLVGMGQLKQSLAAIEWCANSIDRISKDYRIRIKRSQNGSQADELRKQMYGRTSSLVRQISKDLLFLNKARNAIREFPTIDPEVRAIVVAGAPNVGKSQLVGAISTARPKVAVYPFTTKEITVGVLTVKRRRYQIIDTPGLLDRPLDERNEIERQAIIALKHLADLVIFLLDPSGTCGYPLDYQLAILKSVKESYPDAHVIVVENKSDLARTATENLKISASEGSGLEELLAAVESTLTR